jgi:hypothetical protein
MAPLPQDTKYGYYVTPDYQGISYDALTHGIKNTGQSYFNIQDAYCSRAGPCDYVTTYSNRSCDGCGGGGRGNKVAWVENSELKGSESCVKFQAGTLAPEGTIRVYDNMGECKEDQLRRRSN